MSMFIKDRARPNKYRKASYDIRNFSMNDLLKIIREFEKFPYKNNEIRRPKNDATDS